MSIRTTVMLGFSFLQVFNVCSACFFMGYERDVHSALLCTRALCIVNMEKNLNTNLLFLLKDTAN